MFRWGGFLFLSLLCGVVYGRLLVRGVLWRTGAWSWGGIVGRLYYSMEGGGVLAGFWVVGWWWVLWSAGLLVVGCWLMRTLGYSAFVVAAGRVIGWGLLGCVMVIRCWGGWLGLNWASVGFGGKFSVGLLEIWLGWKGGVCGVMVGVFCGIYGLGGLAGWTVFVVFLWGGFLGGVGWEFGVVGGVVYLDILWFGFADGGGGAWGGVKCILVKRLDLGLVIMAVKGGLDTRDRHMNGNVYGVSVVLHWVHPNFTAAED
ncbi:hypothetical protein Tco_0685087 [Tanacetum coccineum]